MRNYIVITTGTLLISILSAASGILVYRETVPKPVRVYISAVCPKCGRQGPTRQYTEVDEVNQTWLR